MMEKSNWVVVDYIAPSQYLGDQGNIEEIVLRIEDIFMLKQIKDYSCIFIKDGGTEMEITSESYFKLKEIVCKS